MKSCTLFGNRVAMFPDAVTARGRRHLLELAELSRGGVRPMVLFVVHTPRADWFMPDYHSDLAFSRTLLEVRDAVEILAAAVSWRPGLRLGPRVRELEIPWDFLEKEVDDRGSYFLLLHLARRRRLRVGQLGPVLFEKGHYVYAGSAMANLGARLARHCRRRKRMHWHVDYLRQAADAVVPVPVRSSRRPGMRAGRRAGGDHGSGRAGVRILRLRVPLPPVPQRGGSSRPPGFPRAAAAIPHAEAGVIEGKGRQNLFGIS